MSFQPIVPFNGYSGWQFLRQTRAAQEQAFQNSPSIQSNVDYFRANISSVVSAEELVNDRRLLTVALGAFGLDADLDNRFFIQKVLNDGSLSETALANKLSDKRYLSFTQAFGFGDQILPNTQSANFAEDIISAYQSRQFEIAVGQQNDNMRLAMNAERRLPELATSGMSNEAKWFSIMGDLPLRKAFETAFGLPASFGQLSVDRQNAEFQNRARQVLGTSDISAFEDPKHLEKFTQMFLLRAQLNGQNQHMSASGIALTLLQGA